MARSLRKVTLCSQSQSHFLYKVTYAKSLMQSLNVPSTQQSHTTHYLTRSAGHASLMKGIGRFDNQHNAPSLEVIPYPEIYKQENRYHVY